MIIYKTQPLFNSRTGKPDGFEYSMDHLICDYSGNDIFDEHGMEDRFHYCYDFKGDHSSETYHYYEDFHKILNKKAPQEKDWKNYISNYSLDNFFAESTYHYCLLNDGMTDASYLIAKEWMEGINEKKSIYYQTICFAHAARKKRELIVIDLLNSKRYTKEQIFGDLIEENRDWKNLD